MERLLNKKEIASLLGVSVKAIDKWIGEKSLPFLRLSRKCIRFKPAEIEAHLRKYKIMPQKKQPSQPPKTYTRES